MRRPRRAPFLLLAFSVFFTLASLTSLQATSATAGPRLLGRLAAAMFELDRWTPAHVEDIRAAAKDRFRGYVDVPGLPLQTAVPVQEAANGSAGEIQAAVTESAGRRLYEQGRSAFRNGDGSGGSISLSEPARWTISLLEKQNHQAWKLLLAAGVLAVMLTSGLVLVASTGGVRTLPRGALAGSLAFVLSCGAAWLFARLVAGAAGSALDEELARIAGDCAWIGLRAGAAIGLGSAAILMMLRLTGQPEPGYATWPGPLDEAA